MEPDFNPAWGAQPPAEGSKIQTSKSRISSWLAVLRPPNFLTVPGDILAGYFLAAGIAPAVPVSGLVVLILAAIFFYAAGLLLNDWADAAVDRIERPERPVPANLISRGAVLLAGVVSLGLAVILCLSQGGRVSIVGIFLAVAICTYNLLTKSLPLVGPLNMGICRGFNFLLGATLAVGFMLPHLAWWGFATIVCYITAVTHLARREMIGRYGVIERWLPPLVLATAFFIYLPLSPLIHWPAQVTVALLLLAAAAGAARTATLLPNRKGLSSQTVGEAAPPTPALIGRLIGLLLPLQAAFIVGSGDGVVPFILALFVLALWPVKRRMGKIFYSS